MIFDQLTRHQKMPVGDALVAVWTEPGINPTHHEAMKSHLQTHWPLLYQQMERLVVEHAEHQRRLNSEKSDSLD